MFQSSMAFVPGLRLLPPPPLRGAICKQVSNIFGAGGWVVFGDEHIRSPKALHQRTQLPLGMHRIQGHNPPLDQRWGEQRFERADFILLLADSALPQHRSGRDVITTELMNRMGLLTGRTKGVPVNGQLRMIEMALARLKATGLAPTPLLGFPSREECGQHFIEQLRIDAG